MYSSTMPMKKVLKIMFNDGKVVTTMQAKVLQFPRSRRRNDTNDGPPGSQIGKGLSKQELRRIWRNFAAGKDERAARNRALLAVWLETGLRVSELARLNFKNSYATDDNGRAFSVRVKGSVVLKLRYHTVLISPQTLRIVEQYHEDYGIASDVLFLTLPLQNLRGKRKPLTRQGLYKIVQSWNAETRGRKLAHPHALRATAGQLIGEKYGLNTVCQLLNHASVSTTRKHYLQPYVSAQIASTWLEVVREEKE